MPQTAPQRPIVSDDVAYLAPMVGFLGLVFLASKQPQWTAQYYVARTILAAGLLIAFRKHFTRIRWHDWWLGLLLGIIGVAQWIAVDKAIMHVWPNYPHAHSEPFDPFNQIANPAWRTVFIAFRWLGPTLVVPFMEELFWRDYLWRSIIAPKDFKLAEVGERHWPAIIIVTLVFASVHPQWITAIVWGALIAALLVRTRSLGACIIMHAVTNFLLGGYVLWAHDWRFW